MPARLGCNLVVLQLPHPYHCSDRQDTRRANSTKDSNLSPVNLRIKIIMCSHNLLEASLEF